MAISSVSIIGSGNLATHLASAFQRYKIEIRQICSRSIQNASILANKIGASAISNPLELAPADLIVICTSDSSIDDVSKSLNTPTSMVVHTSGSTSIDILKPHLNRGVIYPFQTFSKDVDIDFSSIPVFIEANNDENTMLLKEFTERISGNVNVLNSEQRIKLHLAAIFSNNFTNHMFAISREILADANIPFGILNHLMLETTNKAIQSGNPVNVQTGPAVRFNYNILDQHKEILTHKPLWQKIYTFVSDSIMEKEKEKEMEHFKDKLKNIKAFAFDVDGVFSEQVILDSSGELLRTMNIKDGYAVQLAIKRGYPIAIITGGNSQALKIRFESLGVTDVYLKSHYKMDDFNEFLNRYNLSASDVLYMGDDIPDLEILSVAGISSCPADAVEEVKAVSMYISPRKAGKGCVRDVIEQVLKVNQSWLDTKIISG